jgi:hypothetical protein
LYNLLRGQGASESIRAAEFREARGTLSAETKPSRAGWDAQGEALAGPEGMTMVGGGMRGPRRGLAALAEELELFDWYVREVARARDASWRTVLGEHLSEVKQAICRALDSMRSEFGEP